MRGQEREKGDDLDVDPGSIFSPGTEPTFAGGPPSSLSLTPSSQELAPRGRT